MGEWVVGVDLGRTKIALGLIDPQDRIVAYRRLPTNADAGAASVVERIAQSMAELRPEMPIGETIRAIGICTPGPVDHTTGIIGEVHEMKGLHHAPLRDMLAEYLGIPASLDHDAKAAALGEFHYGAGRGERAMVYVVVGTGVGGAIVVDGQLYRGVANAAGEMGHITLNRDGELCPCGSRGCAETYLSGPWLARRYEHRSQRANPNESFQPHVTGERVMILAQQGDEVALEIFREAGEALGIMVASAAMILDIELYVIGGSVAKAGDLLIKPALRSVPGYAYRSLSSRVRIVASTMGEDAPILGCGWMARETLKEAR